MPADVAPRAFLRPISLLRWETMEAIVVDTPTIVRARITREIIQKSVVSMVIMEAFAAEIYATFCAVTFMLVISLIFLTSLSRSCPWAAEAYSITSAPRFLPVRLSSAGFVI